MARRQLDFGIRNTVDPTRGMQNALGNISNMMLERSKAKERADAAAYQKDRDILGDQRYAADTAYAKDLDLQKMLRKDAEMQINTETEMRRRAAEDANVMAMGLEFDPIGTTGRANIEGIRKLTEDELNAKMMGTNLNDDMQIKNLISMQNKLDSTKYGTIESATQDLQKQYGIDQQNLMAKYTRGSGVDGTYTRPPNSKDFGLEMKALREKLAVDVKDVETADLKPISEKFALERKIGSAGSAVSQDYLRREAAEKQKLINEGIKTSTAVDRYKPVAQYKKEIKDRMYSAAKADAGGKALTKLQKAAINKRLDEYGSSYESSIAKMQKNAGDMSYAEKEVLKSSLRINEAIEKYKNKPGTKISKKDLSAAEGIVKAIDSSMFADDDNPEYYAAKSLIRMAQQQNIAEGNK